jgi:aminoglycoside phosphotransferase (APT) family kinase protein
MFGGSAHDAGWPPGSNPAVARSPGVPVDYGREASPALISPAWALQLLFERGLLSSVDTLSGDPTADERSISHSSFCVSVRGQPRWFVKVADPARSKGRTLETEANVYRFAASHCELSGVIPRCRLIGPRASVLVIDAVAGEPLSASLASLSSNDRSSAVLKAYGESVGRLYSARPEVFGNAPWLPVALEPRWGTYSWLPRWCASLLGRLSRSAIVRNAFRQAGAEWRRICLVHGDLRWANALLDNGDGGPNVWLVDWELACVGDPSWDVGSLVADVAAGIAMSNGTGPDVDELLPACGPILTGYRKSVSLDRSRWASLAERGVRMAGVRLVQTIIEYGYASSEDLGVAEAQLAPWMIFFLTQAPEVASRLTGATEVSSDS